MTTHVPQSVELVLGLSVDCNVELVVRQQYLSTAAEELDVEDVDSPPTAVCKQAEGVMRGCQQAQCSGGASLAGNR